MYVHKSKILIDEDIITQVFDIWNGGGKSVQALQTVEQTCLTYHIVIVMSNRGKTVISCTLYINNILCVRVYLSNPKTLLQ